MEDKAFTSIKQTSVLKTIDIFEAIKFEIE